MNVVDRLNDPSKAQETKDAICISTWKSFLKGYNRTTCSQELCAYLDKNMPGWRTDRHKSKSRPDQALTDNIRPVGLKSANLDKTTEAMMPVAQEIVSRFLAKNKQYPSLKLKCRQDPSRAQEYEDAKKLHYWKSHVDEAQAPEVFRYLNEHMPNWRNSHVTTAAQNRKNTPISKAREIVRRCAMRNGKLPELIPEHQQVTPELMLEHRDALKLREWKKTYIENPNAMCTTLIKYLDARISDWINVSVNSNEIPRKMTIGMKQSNDGTQLRGNLSKINFRRTENGTDDEVASSSNSSECSSTLPCFESSDKTTSSDSCSNDTQSLASDENDGVSALLQLSHTVNYQGSFATDGHQGSTYGNGCKSPRVVVTPGYR